MEKTEKTKLIRCSRCKCFKEVSILWVFSECEQCRERTKERFSKKSFLEDLAEKMNPKITYEQAKREKLIENLLREPSREEQFPEEKPKPIDYGEEWQKQSYIEQTRQAEERKKREALEKQQPQPEQA